MKCYANGQLVSCPAFIQNHGGIIFGVIFLIIGLVFLFKSDWIKKLQIKSMNRFGVGVVDELKFKKYWKFLSLLMGIPFILIGLYIFLFLK